MVSGTAGGVGIRRAACNEVSKLLLLSEQPVFTIAQKLMAESRRSGPLWRAEVVKRRNFYIAKSRGVTEARYLVLTR